MLAAPEVDSELLKPIRDLGLTIRGTRLEPLIAAFFGELERAGIRRLRPHVYLSTEWGVPFETISIAIPFYLATPELTRLQAERSGLQRAGHHALSPARDGARGELCVSPL